MTKHYSKQGVTRRELLALGFVVGGLTLIPQHGAVASEESKSISDAKAYKAFLDVSLKLTAEKALHAKQAERTYLGLVRHEQDFAKRIKALDRVIVDEDISMSRLQRQLDSRHRDLADLPRAIATAWFEGIVGKGSKAECVAFSQALMYVPVADVLKPPSYALGEYGIWQSKPPRV